MDPHQILKDKISTDHFKSMQNETTLHEKFSVELELQYCVFFLKTFVYLFFKVIEIVFLPCSLLLYYTHFLVYVFLLLFENIF